MKDKVKIDKMIEEIGIINSKMLDLDRAKKVNYVLDSIVLRDKNGRHFSAYITCKGKEYGFDGESHARMQPFKWKKNLQKDKQWRFSDQYQTFFNFTNGYQELFHYRV